jgi:hypothetical protein
MGGATDWSYPNPITEHLTLGRSPSLAYGEDGSAYAVWDAGGELAFASRSPEGPWSKPVNIAAGTMPSLVCAQDGTLYLLFSHTFMGNDEIYYLTRPPGGQWTLPVNVSRTTGKSYAPSLVITPDQKLSVAWTDNSPGDWVVYYGALTDQFWSSAAVPNATGEAPVMAAGPDGAVYLAWSSPMDPNNGNDVDVFLSQPANPGWTIPANISDTPGTDSSDVTMVAASDGLAHLAWLEHRNGATQPGADIYYSYGRGLAWSAPSFVTSSTTLEEPRLSTDRNALLVLSWVQAATVQASFGPLRVGSWEASSAISNPAAADLRDVSVTAMPHGGVGVSWVQVNSSGAGEVSIYESSHRSVLRAQSWFPLLVHNP